jgi:hypothetical protein
MQRYRLFACLRLGVPEPGTNVRPRDRNFHPFGVQIFPTRGAFPRHNEVAAASSEWKSQTTMEFSQRLRFGIATVPDYPSPVTQLSERVFGRIG